MTKGDMVRFCRGILQRIKRAAFVDADWRWRKYSYPDSRIAHRNDHSH